MLVALTSKSDNNSRKKREADEEKKKNVVSKMYCQKSLGDDIARVIEQLNIIPYSEFQEGWGVQLNFFLSL